MNKNVIFISVLCFILLDYSTLNSGQDYIEENKSTWEQFYLKDAVPQNKVSSWKVPFSVKNRDNLRFLSIVSVFGDHRDSYLKGHIHTAIDIVPRTKSGYVYVYPVAEGVVCSIHLGHPHKTVVVKHSLLNGKTVFTSYKHLQEIYVMNGEQINHDTKLGRLYTHAEARKLGGSYDHLHLEIRKSFDDYGCASWLTMNDAELKKYFYDPMEFLKANIGNYKNH